MSGGINSGVVDENLCVIGYLNLRIADSSVIPYDGIPTGPISSVCMAVGQAAGEMILTKSE